jgi:hypothetical protein
VAVESEGSWPCLQEPATGPYPEPTESTPPPGNLPKIHKITPPPQMIRWVSYWVLTSEDLSETMSCAEEMRTTGLWWGRRVGVRNWIRLLYTTTLISIIRFFKVWRPLCCSRRDAAQCRPTGANRHVVSYRVISHRNSCTSFTMSVGWTLIDSYVVVSVAYVA